jgi:hypothetical protein
LSVGSAHDSTNPLRYEAAPTALSLFVHSSSPAASPVIRGGYLPEMLTDEEAFEAMRHFVIAFWERGGSDHDSYVAELLRWTEHDDFAGGPTFDPAQWDDWLAAVRKAEAGRRDP